MNKSRFATQKAHEPKPLPSNLTDSREVIGRSASDVLAAGQERAGRRLPVGKDVEIEWLLPIRNIQNELTSSRICPAASAGR
jgi:hypothetical protein